MVNKMPGYKTDKYANLRAGYAYMLGHSGKKLLFMGQDFGQEREWSEARELDWFLLQEDLNRGLHDSFKYLFLFPLGQLLHNFALQILQLIRILSNSL